jgi:NADH-quinone oxidoreductase subunit K
MLEPGNMEIERYLAVGAALFVIGALGFLTRRNLILMILSSELMLHGVSLTLVTFGRMHHNLEGQAFTIFILTVAACEAGLALALIRHCINRRRRWTWKCGRICARPICRRRWCSKIGTSRR